MAAFTKELRQQIIEEFARRHGGQYDAALFLAEVKKKGSSHPAYGWFEWDKATAANEYNLWQARAFAQGLRIKFEIQDIKRPGSVRVTHAEMPLVISPMAGRSEGGGYLLTDPDNPEHMAELCHQAATALHHWLRRYGACAAHAGSFEPIEKIAYALEKVGGREAA